MISREIANKLILRLGTQPNAPKSSEAWDDLIDILAERSEDVAHAKEIISKCLEITDENGAGRCPTMIEMRRIAWDTRRTESRANPDCPKCFGSGWEPVEKGGVSAVRKCDCWRRAEKQESPIMPHPRDTSMTPNAEIAPIVAPLPKKKEMRKAKPPEVDAAPWIPLHERDEQLAEASANVPRQSSQETERLANELREAVRTRKIQSINDRRPA